MVRTDQQVIVTRWASALGDAGTIVEVDGMPEAEHLGAFEETALSLTDAFLAMTRTEDDEVGHE